MDIGASNFLAIYLQHSHYNTIYPAYEGISGSPQCIEKSNAYRISRKHVCRVGRQP